MTDETKKYVGWIFAAISVVWLVCMKWIKPWIQENFIGTPFQQKLRVVGIFLGFEIMAGMAVRFFFLGWQYVSKPKEVCQTYRQIKEVNKLVYENPTRVFLGGIFLFSIGFFFSWILFALTIDATPQFTTEMKIAALSIAPMVAWVMVKREYKRLKNQRNFWWL